MKKLALGIAAIAALGFAVSANAADIRDTAHANHVLVGQLGINALSKVTGSGATVLNSATLASASASYTANGAALVAVPDVTVNNKATARNSAAINVGINAGMTVAGAGATMANAASGAVASTSVTSNK